MYEDDNKYVCFKPQWQQWLKPEIQGNLEVDSYLKNEIGGIERSTSVIYFNQTSRFQELSFRG